MIMDSQISRQLISRVLLNFDDCVCLCVYERLILFSQRYLFLFDNLLKIRSIYIYTFFKRAENSKIRVGFSHG